MNYRNILKGLLITYVISIGYVSAQGGVNVQNGNINLYFKDFSVPGHGYNLELERSFNSKSNFYGMFGHKWGSNFNTLFTLTPEGTVEITEYGGGFKTTFAPEKYSQSDVTAFINAIYDKVPAASKSETLKNSLKSDVEFRHKLALEYKVTKPIGFGTKLFANDRGPEVLEKIKSKTGVTQWMRTFADGKKEFFSERGLLIRKEDPNKNFLNLEYDPQGRLAKVTDLSGRQITFTYTAKGLVESVTNPLGKKCTYKYDKEGNLIYAKNAREFEFHHQYNPAHHMTEVSYPASNQKEMMKYDAEDRLTYHEGPEDIISTYQYDTKGNPDKFFNVLITKEVGKKPNHVTTVDKYEYEFGERDNGTSYTAKIVTVLDGVRTETAYNACCGKPLSIAQDGKITKFEYYANGLLKNKISPSGEKVELSYENTFNKVSKVIQSNSSLKQASDITEFKYDANGNLSYAFNKTKKISVQLFYDTKGRIKQLQDQNKRKIFFDYNELGKPTKISLEGTGSIVVSYNAGGEITNVKSTAGRQIAVDVTAAFQSLLDIIRPAGVSLNI